MEKASSVWGTIKRIAYTITEPNAAGGKWSTSFSVVKESLKRQYFAKGKSTQTARLKIEERDRKDAIQGNESGWRKKTLACRLNVIQRGKSLFKNNSFWTAGFRCRKLWRGQPNRDADDSTGEESSAELKIESGEIKEEKTAIKRKWLSLLKIFCFITQYQHGWNCPYIAKTEFAHIPIIKRS